LSVSSNRDRFIYSPARDADSLRASGHVEFASPALVMGSASFGFLHLRSPHTLAADFDGIIANVDLAYVRPLGGTVHVGFERSLLFSYDVNRAFYVLRNVEGSYTRPVGTSWRVLAFAERHNLKYPTRFSQLESPSALMEGGGAIAYQLA